MKALTLLANQKLEIQDIQEPQAKEDHSIIAIQYVGLCSSDIARTYSNGAYFYPLVIGHEAMGKVLESCDEALSQGDRVVIFPLKPCFDCSECISQNYQRCSNYSYYGSREHGAMQEKLSVANWNLIKIPNNVQSKDAALTEPTAVMMHVKNILLENNSLDQIRSSNGAIIGGGFLSMILSKILIMNKISNYTIFDRNEYKINFAKSKGITVKSHNDLNSEKLNSSFDWIVEASGDPNSIETAIRLCKSGGLIILMSNIYNDVTISKKTFSDILRKELILKGSWNSTFNKESRNDWMETLDYFGKGLTPSEFITHNSSLEEIDSIIDKFYQHKQRKIVFDAVKAIVSIDHVDPT